MYVFWMSLFGEKDGHELSRFLGTTNESEGGKGSRRRARECPAEPDLLGFFCQEAGKLLAELGGDLAEGASLGEFILSGEPFDHSRDERNLSHSQLGSQFFERLLGARGQFQSDNSSGHKGSPWSGLFWKIMGRPPKMFAIVVESLRQSRALRCRP